MNHNHRSTQMQEPLDDRLVTDVPMGIYGLLAILVAHRLKLFPLLASGPRTIPDICAALSIRPRPAQAILAAAASHGFVRSGRGSYALTPVGEKYLLETSPDYFGFYWDLFTANAGSVLTYSSIERC